MQTVRFNPLSGLIRQVLVPFGLLAVPSVVVASPQGGVVTNGQGAISSRGAVTTVQQHSQRLVTQWNGFNIDINEAVNFLQPSSSAIALARILDQSPSQILGGISANGRLVLSNPNGLIFAPSATVNVGSLIASGLDITAGDFMAGNLRFEASGTAGTVINHGLLQAATGGSINLLGGAVVNTGTIVADYGEVNLGAGRTVTLDFDGDGLIQFAVEGDLTSDGNSSGIAISNSGVIQANGGQVLLLAQAAKDVFSQVINNSGVIRAQGIDTSGGTVRLVGSGGGVNNSGAVDVSAAGEGLTGGSIELKGETVVHTGVLSADAQSGAGGSIDLQADNETLVSDGVISARSESAGVGGDVTILGNLVELTGNTSVDVSGANGGGTILVGGDYKGANPDINNAEETLIDEGVTLKADALNSGDGGKVIVWADGTTRFFGQLYARGGDVGGDGGFAEISGKQNLFINSLTDQIDISAIAGLNGSLLLDPNDINITVGDGGVGTGNTVGGTPESANTLDDEDIADFLENTGSLTIETSGAGGNGDITIDDSVDIQWTAASTLTLDASRDITFTGTATIAGTNAAADITFDADRNITLAATTLGSGNGATIAFNIGLGGVGGTLDLGSAALAAGDTVNASGGGGTNIFQLSVSNVDLVTGGAGTDTIQGADAANTWNLTGAGVGDVGGSNFTGIENLTGGSNTDNFEFASGSSVSGTVSGGSGGTDTLDYETDDFNAAVTIDLQNGTATGTGGIANIDAVVGDSGFNATNVLVGADAANTWNITGADDGNIGGTFTFTDMGNLTGGSNTDAFILTGGGSVSVLITGSGGSDTIQGDDLANTWNLTGAGVGDVGGSNFTGIENLTGGSNTDNFEFASGSSVSGTVSGGSGGTDTLDYETDDFNAAVTIDLQNGTATGTGGIANIDAVVGDSGFNATNVLVGADAANTWNITGADDGNIGGTFTFTDMGNLTGGSNTDAFILTGGGSVSVLITGSGGSDTIQGDDLANTWNLTGAGVGDVGGSNFTGIENLTGGSNTDNFEFASGSSVSGTVSGGSGGTDTLDYETDDFNAAVTIDLQNGTATGTGGIANIDAVVGDSGFNATNVLVGADAANTWNITGADDGNIGGTFTFTDMGNLTGGSNTDNFEFASGSSVSGTVSGGSGGTDTLDYETDDFNAAVTIDLQNGTATGTGGIANIDAVVGDSGFNATNVLVGADAANTWNITGADDGNIGGTFTFTDMGNLTGGSNTDAFILTGGGSVSVLITGSGGSDTIQGDDLANTWNLTGAGVGDVGGSNFTGIENLTGGSNTDNFEFASGSSVSGTVSGGSGGTDTLDYETDDFNAAVTIDLQNGTATGTGGIANIDAVVGDSGFNATNVLVGADAANTWNITGADDGNIGGTFTFTDMGNLTGGSNTDAFILTGGGSVSVLITGSGGSDTIQGDDLANTWNLTGAGVGDVGGSNFTGIENLTGGSNTDNFEFASGSSVSGTVSGGSGGTDTLDYETDDFNAAVTIDLQNGTATGTGGIANIDAVVGDSGFNATNVLVGADAANTWNITGADDGNIGGTFTFTDMGNLTGGSNTDAFILSNAGSVVGVLDGQGGNDTLTGDADGNAFSVTGVNSGALVGKTSGWTSIEALSGGAGVDSFTFANAGNLTGAVDGLGGNDVVIGDANGNVFTITGANVGTLAGKTSGWSNIEALTGGAGVDTFAYNNAGSLSGAVDGEGGNDTITGDADGNTFNITAANSGTLTGKTSGWSNIEALNGGAGDDAFTFGAAGSLAGLIDAAAHAAGDTVDYSAAAPLTVTIGTNFTNIETVTGGNAGFTLAGDVNFTVTGANDGTAGSVAFIDFESLTGGAGSNSFTFTDAGNLSGSINGAGGGGDSLIGDSDGNAFNITGANSGTLTGKTSGWSNIEIISGGIGADTFVFGNAGSISGALAGGAGNDLLIGDANGNVFTITGANAGTLAGKTSGWSGVEALTGGAGVDSFTFANAGSLTGSLSGAGGNDALIGDANGNAFVVTGVGAGALADTGGAPLKTSGWSGIENISGGAGTDTFNIQVANSLTRVDGVGGSDTVNLNGVGASAVGRILGADVTITSTGAIGTAGAGAQDIQVTSLTVTAGGNVFLKETNGVLIKSISAGGNQVSLTAGGSINDFTADNDNGIDITANRVVLKAGSGLGNDARLELGTTLLDARTTSGDVRIVNNQTLQLEKVTTGNGDVEVAAVGQLTVGDGTPGADVVVANGGNVALAADPGQTGSFDLIQRGNVNATSGTVLLLASGNVLADNPNNVVSVAQASFVVDSQQTSLIAGGFIGSTDGLTQSNAIATTSSSIFANQAGDGDAFLISGFGVTTAATSGFDSNSLFGGVISGALNLSFGASNSSVSNAAAGQASAAAGESQNADASDEGYIDPALYDLSLNIFDTVQGGILLPQDQLESGGGGGDGSDFTDNADLGIDEEVFETTEEFETLDLGPEPELFDDVPVEDEFNIDLETLDFIEEPIADPSEGGNEFDVEEFDLEDFDEDSLELEFEGDEEEFEDFDEDFDIEGLESLTINQGGYGELIQVHFDNSQLWKRGVITLIVRQSMDSENQIKSI
ncbi:MAG: filamentous hemagglutinin N-terminal domain-containing protein [Immundisolibacteraceae bacterium]|nr:filamentous hemagglutinin N-terminal domain-containing protein [Immundisolibacteraceae bacterium]